MNLLLHGLEAQVDDSSGTRAAAAVCLQCGRQEMSLHKPPNQAAVQQVTVGHSSWPLFRNCSMAVGNVGRQQGHIIIQATSSLASTGIYVGWSWTCYSADLPCICPGYRLWRLGTNRRQTCLAAQQGPQHTVMATQHQACTLSHDCFLQL